MRLVQLFNRFTLSVLFLVALPAIAQDSRFFHWDKAAYPIHVPYLEHAPKIDGNLNDWKNVAFTDGLWDIFRVAASPWYDPSMSRLTLQDHETEPPEDDLSSRYYMAWDHTYLYFGAEVHDNVNDETDPEPHPDPKRWYFKDSLCWFIEAPLQPKPDKFGKGANAFCFLADPSKPSNGAWWRHGTPTQHYVEEPLPSKAVDYVVRMNPWGRSKGDYILEARVNMAMTLGKSDPAWQPPQIGDRYGLEIVQPDPDGGGYGGHILIFGDGDDDESWGMMTLTGPIQPLERKPD